MTLPSRKRKISNLLCDEILGHGFLALEPARSGRSRVDGPRFKFDKAQPVALFKVLSAWSDGDRKVKPDAPKDHVLREVGALEQALKGVATWAA